ncbi:Carbohydrate esterase family 16 protein [Mycena sanguinolenta]|uniref:Carbohydrate esterase family 16 protein n=1 Tax=Mycena sanguinolenta TaxID=230812 RepID=A0A8H6YTE9_9AGAR|nr:Carbohydrate esterase family 16 protein [Mycena sanguinolenta]
MAPLWTSLLFALLSVAAFHLPVERQTNDGVHLAITPPCGTLGGTFANTNAGIVTAGIKTLVAFGVRFVPCLRFVARNHSPTISRRTHTRMVGARMGGPLPPTVLNGTSPSAGGRVTDGPVWAEDVASDLNAVIMDYAVAGAVVNVTLWPSAAGHSDFIQQADGDHLPQAAADLLAQIQQLAAAPTHAKNILVLDDYGLGVQSATGDAWKQAVFDGLSTFRKQGFNVGFVNFAPLWDAVVNTSPGFAAFGYDTIGPCIPEFVSDGLVWRVFDTAEFVLLVSWVRAIPLRKRIVSWLIISILFSRTARHECQ